ncbi:GDSL-like Lipase/Acylhydrolase family protein [Streptoalloteichus tenebrarius]|uniref:GDSL-like Lipase/Acylhydrolase family protein n=1 Tax=Streptoalloteichus tenebrarius (strain ATCC 17920 / DSM 40477 / JCM 4838 / CBS 697.72 / NBRC 16177 / NCIMB 11028 / NRRL B-12390 / A12253. 1 / ISP 5477) TaxID=1933 RepID=A0ABT1HTQ3_STRSD|nr:GDSL-type esterase/lipase family protein [Streptoalloteichus tenebrarius]MCP2258889.1 GDSL-like Lipase/Acylhydrolase family protein [Streptoalloteichus tenebrarius]BFE99426.1 GDSL-type esterase/lipase family protein [Streptoalloteichus tenebrarius]
MRALRTRLLAALLIIPVLTVFLLVSDRRHLPPSPPEDKPRALVALGDSTISGEGAGDYEPGTRGENGNWCHRSPNALIHRTALPGVDRTINLACSGANADQVALGDATQYTEGSQARRLADVARDNRVVAVVVGVGANDDPKFGDVVMRCMRAGLVGRDPDCHKDLGAEWAERVDRMVPKVVRALHDVRSVMRRAGYPDTSYSLVVQSYAAPVGTSVSPSLQNLNGCPFRTSDLKWVEDSAVGRLAAGLHRAADLVGARFLDLSRAGRGHEACAGGPQVDREWFARLSLDWEALRDDQRAEHFSQESFHPNARGHSQFGRCLGEFLATRHDEAACLKGPDGFLHPVPDQAVRAAG